MTVILSLREAPDIPLEADTITPTHFAGKSAKEIGEILVQKGNETLKLKDFFDISGESGPTPDETEILVKGDLKKVKMIGKGMNGGRITVEGDTGMYLGAEMIAGRIHVKGSVGPWAAAEMEGGNIQIEGDAADYLCAGYRGSTDGMKGGRVYVAGDVGREMAAHMRKGFIAVKGNVGPQSAIRMMGGTIIVVGDMAERVGVQATKGMIFCLGKLDSLFPTYKFSGSSEREFINYYLRYLKDRRPDFLSEDVDASEKWVKYMGDFAEASPGEEIFIRASKNQHLI
ncbi:MAG: formylmethanofuran dehydrogenase subunit C [Candidatus Thorarchaeota archaeon]|jgi:formylmethanofuran dehydrogenase subunit C